MQLRDEKGRFCKCNPKLDEYSYVAGFKAFNSDLTCRGKQYKEGETFTEANANMCVSGMHYCINPFYIFKYYDLFDSALGIIKVANVTGKIKYSDVVRGLSSWDWDSKVVTAELRIDKVWNVLDYLRIYASKGYDNLYINYYPISSSVLVRNGADAARSIVVDNRETFVMYKVTEQLLTDAHENFLGVNNGTIYCSRSRALLDVTGCSCNFAGIGGVHYRMRNTKGKTLFEGHIGNAGDLLPNTMYRFDSSKKKLIVLGEDGATHL